MYISEMDRRRRTKWQALTSQDNNLKCIEGCCSVREKKRAARWHNLVNVGAVKRRPSGRMRSRGAKGINGEFLGGGLVRTAVGAVCCWERPERNRWSVGDEIGWGSARYSLEWIYASAPHKTFRNWQSSARLVLSGWWTTNEPASNGALQISGATMLAYCASSQGRGSVLDRLNGKNKTWSLMDNRLTKFERWLKAGKVWLEKRLSRNKVGIENVTGDGMCWSSSTLIGGLGHFFCNRFYHLRVVNSNVDAFKFFGQSVPAYRFLLSTWHALPAIMYYQESGALRECLGQFHRWVVVDHRSHDGPSRFF